MKQKQSPPTIEDVVREHDLRPNRSDMILCPAHEEDTPSCQLNYDDNYYYCFGCGATGDGVGLLALLRGEPVEDVLRTYAAAGAGWTKPIRGLSERELRANVWAEYSQVSRWFFDSLHHKLYEGPMWILELLLDRWNEEFEELTDALNDDELTLYDKDQLIRQMKGRLERWLYM